jgi:hypothetical protein
MIEPCVENTTANRDRLYPASVRGWDASRRTVCFNGRTCGRKRRTLSHNISFFNQECRHLVVLGTGKLVDRGESPWYVRYSVSDSVSDQVCASTDAPGRRHIHSNKINSTGKSVGRGESPLPHNCQLSDSCTPSGVKIPCLSTPQ